MVVSCNGNEPGSKEESIGMIGEPMAVDERVLAADTSVRVDLNVCRVGFSILNTQVYDKVNGMQQLSQRMTYQIL